MLYLTFIIEKRMYLAAISINVKCNFAIGKCLKFTNKTLTKFMGAKGNLITTNFVSSNHYFGINSSSFSSLNLKKVSLMNLRG